MCASWMLDLFSLLHLIDYVSFLGKCLEKIESSIKETKLKNDDSASNDDTKKDKMCEKVGQMKTILHELSSSYPINDQIVLPPNEINVSNMESYVGKPKYLKDRLVFIAGILL